MKKSDVIGFGIVFLMCVWMITTFVVTLCVNPLLGIAIGVGGWLGLNKLSC
jgi:hypothetical protein